MDDLGGAKSLHIAHWALAEEATVFPIELANTLLARKITKSNYLLERMRFWRGTTVSTHLNVAPSHN